MSIKIKCRKFEKQLPYLYYKNGSQTLVIIFSAFTGEKRKFNYVKGLRNTNIDRLYILDPWGYKGSYNLYENGFDSPDLITCKLINKVLRGGGYKRVFMAGSSKGGTCAIYFGLKFRAAKIIAGACQYNLGTYLHRPDHEKIFISMMGKNAGEDEAYKLNQVLPSCLEAHKGCNSEVHILYSKLELTYQRQIVDLLCKLKECNIKTIEIERPFEKHEDVGKYFLPYLLAQIQNE